jgi:pimeloyl-ACP methyl ester carboxylesterase
MQEGRRHFNFILIFVSAIILLLLMPHPIGISWAQTTPATTTDIIIQFPSIVSTRGHFDLMTGELLPGHNKTDYASSNIPGLQSGVCPPEIVIIVHGWGLTEDQAKERFDRVKMSLEHNRYNISIIGFSWDSNALWTFAKSISKDNGLKLAEFIFDLRNKCPDTAMRIIAHSLGSRVVLDTLCRLHNNQEWNNNNSRITSVHLMGGAIDNDEVSKNQQDINIDATNWNTVKTTAYGQAIQEEVVEFYNLYNPEDSIFEPNTIYPFYPFQIYPSYEGDWALGQSGYQTIPYDIILSLLTNYNQINVQNEIPPMCNADGDNKPDFPLATNLVIRRGDNHGGYFGFRDAANNTKLMDDGAINIVVDNWKKVLPDTRQIVELSAICN